MSETTASLRRQIESAADLQSVVRTMRAMAAASIGQYERSVRALADYARTVELGLSVCVRHAEPEALARPARMSPGHPGAIGAVVFGSDQGLVGRFNDVVADHAIAALAALPGTPRVWAVGERVHAALLDAGLLVRAHFPVPGAVAAIAPLVGRILVESESGEGGAAITELHLFYNRPTSAAGYAPVGQRLLPLDDTWHRTMAARRWPGEALPEVIGAGTATLRSFVREYLFVSLFRACAESLASENASRLTAMQRADQNIDDLLAAFSARFHRVRQSGIDEELFDVIAGFEVLAKPKAADGPPHRRRAHTRGVRGPRAEREGTGWHRG